MDVIASVIRAAAGEGEELQGPDLQQLPNDSKATDQTSGPLEPVRSAPASLSSDAIFPSADNLYSTMENFDVRSAELEAEDRLSQLVLEDELSDVRIHEGAMATGGVSTLEGATVTGGGSMEGAMATGGVVTHEKASGAGRGVETQGGAKMATGSMTGQGNVDTETG